MDRINISELYKQHHGEIYATDMHINNNKVYFSIFNLT